MTLAPAATTSGALTGDADGTPANDETEESRPRGRSERNAAD